MNYIHLFLLQDTINGLLNKESCRDHGTLYQLKLLFRHTAVSKSVKDCFRPCYEFVQFVTAGHVVATVMQYLKLNHHEIPSAIDDRSNASALLDEVAGHIHSDESISRLKILSPMQVGLFLRCLHV